MEAHILLLFETTLSVDCHTVGLQLRPAIFCFLQFIIASILPPTQPDPVPLSPILCQHTVPLPAPISTP